MYAGLNCILNFDSTQGVIQDLTGLNTLTATNVTVQRVGKVYSAYFNGSNSVITFPLLPSMYSTTSMIVSVWFKRLKQVGNGYALILHNIANTLYPINIQLNTSGISLWFPTITAYYFGGGEKYSAWYNAIIIANQYYNYGFVNNSIVTNNVKTTTQFSLNSTFIFSMGNFASAYIKEYIAKAQIFTGIPQNPANFAANLYNSQRNLFNV